MGPVHFQSGKVVAQDVASSIEDVDDTKNFVFDSKSDIFSDLIWEKSGFVVTFWRHAKSRKCDVL